MKISEKIAIAMMLLATVGIVLAVLAVEKYRSSKVYTVQLTAREPDHGNWHQRIITVPKGRPVKIVIRNIETVSHGFALPEFDVAIREIKAGHVESVVFTPDKAGSFMFLCTVWCSPRHQEMTGTLIVE